MKKKLNSDLMREFDKIKQKAERIKKEREARNIKKQPPKEKEVAA